MRLFLLVSLLFIAVHASAQARIDTIRCGSIIGYGNIANGKKEGNWKYYDTIYKTPYYAGSYHEGLKTGEWIIYPHPFTNIKRVVHYKNGILNGEVAIYREENKLDGKGSYLNGSKNGEWVYYHINTNKIRSIEHYQNGVPYGHWISFSDEHSSWSGEMNAYGLNGIWTYRDTSYQTDLTGYLINPTALVDSVLYQDGKEEGFWNNKYGKGYFVHGKKEGRWLETNNRNFYRFTEYKNGLRNGYDSLFVNDTLESVSYYKDDKINGTESIFHNGRLTEQGISITNPQHYFPDGVSNRIEVPIDIQIDLIENGICNNNLVIIFEFANLSVEIRDSLIMLLKAKMLTYIPEVVPSANAFSSTETVRTGYWKYYWGNGNLKEEGYHLPIVKDSSAWDSTNQTEDPNNPGTYIIAPLKTEYLTYYYKTGTWKYYNQKGEMICEERYDEFGKLMETKLLKN
ncbi:MAG: hypothetical protein ABIQ40_19980 [Bacteroidia bacterium]